MKKICCSIAVVVLLSTLTACGQTDAQVKESNEKINLVFDNYGDQVKISEVPQKVITMGPSSSELFCALGISDKIIGNTLDNHSRGALPEYKKDYDKIPELNYGSATREAVLSSEADFIYGIDWDFGEEGLDKQELDDYGINVYLNRAKTIEEEYQEITDIGKIFKVEDQAEAFIADQKQRIEKVENQTKESNRKRVLVFDSGEKGIFTCSGSNFESLLIRKAGGINLFEDLKDKDWLTVSEEEVLARDPEVIIVHDYDQPPVADKIKQIKNDPVLSKTTAVRENKIITVPLESVLPGPRMATTIELFQQAFN